MAAWLALAKLLTETLLLESNELRTIKVYSEFELLGWRGRKRHDGDVIFVFLGWMVVIATRHCFILCMAVDVFRIEIVTRDLST